MNRTQLPKEVASILKPYTAPEREAGEYTDKPLGEFIAMPNDPPIKIKGRTIK